MHGSGASQFSGQLGPTHGSIGRPLVKTLVVPLDADLSRIASRDENEIGGRQHKTHRPPNGGGRCDRHEQRSQDRNGRQLRQGCSTATLASVETKHQQE